MKVYHILIGIILILIACVVKITCFNGYTEKTVEKLIEKSYNAKNYSITFNFKGNVLGQDFTVKGKSKVLYSKYVVEADWFGSQLGYYIDKDADEFIIILDKYAAVGKYSELGDDKSFGMININADDIVEHLKSKDYKYTYIGIENCHSKECICFTIEKQDGTEIYSNIYKQKYYIDKKKGNAEKMEYYDSSDQKVLECEMETKFNGVKEIKKPNVSGLTVVTYDSLKKK